MEIATEASRKKRKLTLSRTQPPAILHEVVMSFCRARFFVHSSKSVQICSSTSVSLISIFSGISIRPGEMVLKECDIEMELCAMFR